MSKIRFELRTEKTDQQGKAPIRLIYQISGQRKYFNTGLKTYPQTWEADKQQVKYLDRKGAKREAPQIEFNLLPSDKEAKDLNNQLNDLQKQIQAIESRFVMDKVVYSADMVIKRLNEEKTPTTKKDTPTKFLLDFIDRYITDHKATREAGSLTVYRSLKTHLQDYQQATKRKYHLKVLIMLFFSHSKTFLLKRVNTLPTKKD